MLGRFELLPSRSILLYFDTAPFGSLQALQASHEPVNLLPLGLQSRQKVLGGKLVYVLVGELPSSPQQRHQPLLGPASVPSGPLLPGSGTLAGQRLAYGFGELAVAALGQQF